jgi:hypothetical protein
VLNLVERGLLDRRSYPIRVVTERVVQQERVRDADARVRGEAEQSAVKLGTRRKAEGCRREWKGAQGVRYLTSPFLCPWPSLASDSLFFLFQGERRHLSVLFFAMLVFLIHTRTCMIHIRAHTYMYTYSESFLVPSSVRAFSLASLFLLLFLYYSSRITFPSLAPSAKIVTVLLSPGW